MAQTDSKFPASAWATAPTYAGGDRPTAEAGQAEVLDSEAQKIAGDPTLTDQAASIARERGRLDAPPSANALKLMGITHGAKDDTPTPPSPAAARLLGITNGIKPVDASDPEGNKDARDIQASPAYQQQIDQDEHQSAGSKWLQSAMGQGGRFALASPEQVQAQRAYTPRAGMATARGAIQSGLGQVGDVAEGLRQGANNLTGVEIPGLPVAMRGPTSSDINELQTGLGWKPDPAYPEQEEKGRDVGGMLTATIPGTAAVKSLKSGADYLLAGGKGGQALREVGEDIAGRAKPLTEAAPEAMGPAVPGREAVTRGMPGTSKATGLASAPVKESGDFEGLVKANNQRLTEAKRAAQAKLESTLPNEKKPDMSDVKSMLENDIRDAGDDSTRMSLGKILNDIHYNEDNSKVPFKSMNELRRKISDAIKDPNDVSGFKGVGQALSTKYSNAFKQALTDAHPPYGTYLSEYSRLSKQSEPAMSRFLSEVGEKEGGGDLVGMALRTPKNVDAAIKATGGNAKAFDAMATKRVVNELQGKSTEALNTWARENTQVLNKLPATKAAVTKMQNMSERVDAIQGIAGKLQGVSHASREAAQAAAQKYELPLTALQNTPAAKQAPILKNLAAQLRQDNLITADEYGGMISQIAAAERGANIASKMGTLAKYIAYSATGNYLVSFGGPALVGAARALSP